MLRRFHTGVVGLLVVGAGLAAAGQAAHAVDRLQHIEVLDDWAFVTAADGPTSLSTTHTCGTRLDHTLWCWGLNSDGQLGLGDRLNRYRPYQVGSDQDWATVSVGDSDTCAIRSAGTLWCWGSTYDSLTPVQVGAASTWHDISLGSGFRCGLQDDSTLWCWGDNSIGQLGLGDQVDRTEPTEVGTGWAGVSAGGDHTCGIRVDASLWCWGYNGDGQLGVGSPPVFVKVPTQVDVGSSWRAVDLGAWYTCGIHTDGSLWCWGNNDEGQLGIGNQVYQDYPVQVGQDRTWASVNAGEYHVCAVRAEASLWCWGGNGHGESGIGQPPYTQTTPARVGTSDWVSVGAGDLDSCGIRSDHTLWCWGYPKDGELGVGNRTRHTDIPVQVGLPNRRVPLSYSLAGVDAVARDDIWAVGEQQRKSVVSTFVEHGDGSSWSRVPSVDPGSRYSSLAAVSAVSSSDAWAVGGFQKAGVEHPLLEHWDGSQWVRDAAAHDVRGALVAVSAASANDVWAVGHTAPSFDYDQTLVLHWDGTQWRNIPTAPHTHWAMQTLTGVAELAPDDVWVVGYGLQDEEAGYLPLAEHWDGAQWHEVRVRFGDRFDDHFLRAIAAVGRRNVWALGDRLLSYQHETTLAEHWKGTAWDKVDVPDPGVAPGTYLYGADALRAEDVWAVGRTSDGSQYGAFTAHWDGQAWWPVEAPSPAGKRDTQLSGIDSVAADDVWAVGFSQNDIRKEPLIEHWDGSVWTIVQSGYSG